MIFCVLYTVLLMSELNDAWPVSSPEMIGVRINFNSENFLKQK